MPKQSDVVVAGKRYPAALADRSIVSAYATNLHGVRSNAWDSQLWNIADWRRYSGE